MLVRPYRRWYHRRTSAIARAACAFAVLAISAASLAADRPDVTTALRPQRDAEQRRAEALSSLRGYLTTLLIYDPDDDTAVDQSLLIGGRCVEVTKLAFAWSGGLAWADRQVHLLKTPPARSVQGSDETFWYPGDGLSYRCARKPYMGVPGTTSRSATVLVQEGPTALPLQVVRQSLRFDPFREPGDRGEIVAQATDDTCTVDTDADLDGLRCVVVSYRSPALVLRQWYAPDRDWLLVRDESYVAPTNMAPMGTVSALHGFQQLPAGTWLPRAAEYSVYGWREEIGQWRWRSTQISELTEPDNSPLQAAFFMPRFADGTLLVLPDGTKRIVGTESSLEEEALELAQWPDGLDAVPEFLLSIRGGGEHGR